MLQDSGGSRSDSDNEQSECPSDDEGGSAPGASGHAKQSQRLAGRKHKSDTVLQKSLGAVLVKALGMDQPSQTH